MPRTVTVRAPGKVNLQLAVGPRRDDGYHRLVTVFQAVSLYETVTATARDDEDIVLRIAASPALTFDPASVPTDESNLAVRAARAVAERYGITDGIDLDIVKGIPVAGGMAGGSADAAAAAVACAEAWDTGASRVELEELCAGLGADVPFCLHGHTAVGLGRGDELSPAMTHGQFHWVFATQSEGLSTPAVFREFDRAVAAGEAEVAEPALDDAVMAALMAGDPRALGSALTNDLQPAALRLAPHLQDVIDAAKDADAVGAIVSGSGPTVAALARSRQHALAIAAHLTAEDVAHTVLTASGPAAGAAIVADLSD
ncbi:4-(cytidine 5'-diphospho)-2-C-methyl-D-erythritol kinase [Demequina zhanjiangensis]|uniref:4-diphosphocytidyl-2-C-methyl-D-erythritol kinase n=1 Tax=Demequina zhanjiangensis TaxID=3051659 RepID=A0ABT8G504_9MICO|nr:4-(cytidine 5'-diphospho)-2-C-methyl-D-erythritol kinase [Demequina sp. SYSU T00b26]MDN4474203.1 4-(cytidine 5'-diphospho)-2-C-methyl-D-erythritol kinase [Demequina sp. SYSU T00b26]